MKRRKKILWGLLIASPILALVLYVAGNMALTSASRRVLGSLVVPARQNGVELMRCDFAAARIAGLRSVRWRNLNAVLELTKRTGFVVEEQFSLTIKSVTAKLSGVESVSFVAEGLTLRRMPPGSGDATEHDTAEDVVVAERVVVKTPFDLNSPGKSLRQLVPRLIDLVTNGEASAEVTTRGTLTFPLLGDPVELPFSVVNVDSMSWFSLKKNGVEKIAAKLNLELTSTEVDLLAEHPLQAPHLLRIKNDAEQTSARAAAEDPNVPQDAYRHVLWSYLLTKRFGADFAKLVTDAHEIGATDNTPADHRMDYNNNEIGRAYATDGTQRNKILSRLQNDPQVIRQPQ